MKLVTLRSESVKDRPSSTCPETMDDNNARVGAELTTISVVIALSTRKYEVN